MAERAGRAIWNPELFLLAALAALTRLWGVFAPNAVVFDELHFERHAGHYFAGTFYLDVHPPLGKLLYAGMARMMGVSAQTLIDGRPAAALRLLPAVLGAMVVPLVYAMIMQLGASRRVATLGAFVVLCENALIADARFIFLEPLMIAFALASIVGFLAARCRHGFARWGWLAFAALLAGCAISVKWTGASALGLIGATWLFDVVRRNVPRQRALGEGALMVLVPAAVYVAVWAVHFALLRSSGPDDAALPLRLRQTLIGNPAYQSGAHVSLLAKISDIHTAISTGNGSLVGVTHPAASPWYTWPIMKHPIGLWQDAADPPTAIILLGNPFVWWGSLAAALVGMAWLARRRYTRTGGTINPTSRFAIAFAGGGFLFNFLPFIAIQRVMYLYHYLFALVWLVALAILVLDAMLGWSEQLDAPLWTFGSRRAKRVYWFIVAGTLAGFLYFAPLTYGWPLSQSAYDAHFRELHPL